MALGKKGLLLLLFIFTLPNACMSQRKFDDSTIGLVLISAVQASDGIQPQSSRCGPDEILAATATAAARFTCQYGSRNGSRPLIALNGSRAVAASFGNLHAWATSVLELGPRNGISCLRAHSHLQPPVDQKSWPQPQPICGCGRLRVAASRWTTLVFISMNKAPPKNSAIYWKPIKRLYHSKLNIKACLTPKKKIQDLYFEQSNYLTMNFFGWTATHVRSVLLLGTISHKKKKKEKKRKKKEKFVVCAIHDG
jgi:hypothetical protein